MSRRARWLGEWRKSTGKPVFYHVISRVVDRRFALGTEEKEKEKEKEEAEREREQDGEIPLGKMLRCRVRYFTDGAVIGSRSFVDEAFASARERFGAKRKDGARTMRGSGSGAKGLLWSIRDLHKGMS
jgi:hypothetical protein